jgi:hypothetical protein
MAKNDEIYYPPTASKKPASTGTKSAVTTSAPPQTPTSSFAQLPPTNVMALIGFILSIAGFFTFVTAIPGVILGHIALRQIRVTREAGHGLAVAALAVGYSVIALGVLTALIVFAIILVPLLILGSAGFPDYYP